MPTVFATCCTWTRRCLLRWLRNYRATAKQKDLIDSVSRSFSIRLRSSERSPWRNELRRGPSSMSSLCKVCSVTSSKKTRACQNSGHRRKAGSQRRSSMSGRPALSSSMTACVLFMATATARKEIPGGDSVERLLTTSLLRTATTGSEFLPVRVAVREASQSTYRYFTRRARPSNLPRKFLSTLRWRRPGFMKRWCFCGAVLTALNAA